MKQRYPDHWARGLAKHCMLYAGLVLTITPAIAQDATEDDEVFELSPFTVDASEDMGYYASQTLAGGRLSTDIINTGSSIEVITADFMDDIGANDIQELLQYTNNTEIGGMLGNFTGVNPNFTLGGDTNNQGAVRNPDNNARVRGLASPDKTRDFFKTDIPFDQYNTERVDINRGSNSFLFGLGSPGGLINNQLSRAHFNERTRVRFRLASGGERPAYRGEFDYNRPIIKNKLAVRIAGVANRTQYRQKPTYRDDNRIYGTATWHPFDNNKRTTVRFSYESGDTISNTGSTSLPYQALDTFIEHRLPIDVFYNIRTYRNDEGPGENDIRDDRIPHGSFPTGSFWPSYEVNNKNRVVEGTYKRPGIGALFGNFGADGYTLIFDGSNGADAAFALRTKWRGIQHHADRGSWNSGKWKTKTPGDPFWSPDGKTNGNPSMKSYDNSKDTPGRDIGWFRQGFTDLETFDFSKYSLSGDNDYWERDFYFYNGAIEHLFLDGKAGFEFAFDFESHRRNAQTFFSGGKDIKIDINQTMPLPILDAKGEPIRDENGNIISQVMENPNFGRPYFESRRDMDVRRTDRQAMRATAFYRLNFEDFSGDDGWLRWLGEHTISVLADSYEEDFLNVDPTLRSYADDVDLSRHYGTTAATVVSNGDRQVGLIAYLGPPIQSYLGDEVWDPSTPLKMSDIILEQSNYNMRIPAGWSIPLTYWNYGEDADTVPIEQIGNRNYTVNGNESWQTTNLTPEWIPDLASQIRRTEVKSWAINTQSFFLNRHLVVNAGYREDFIDSWLNRTPPLVGEEARPVVDPEVFHWEDGEFDQVVKGPDGSGVFGYGAVVHWPKEIIQLPASMDISFHYNHSENFIPDSSRRTIDGSHTYVRLPSPTGSSKDYGVTLQLFDRKLIVRLNWYENQMENDTSPAGARFKGAVNTIFNWWGNANQERTELDSTTGDTSGVYDGVIDNEEALSAVREGIEDENGNPVYQVDENGEIILDDDGEPVPVWEPVEETVAREWPYWDEANVAREEAWALLQQGYWQIKVDQGRLRELPSGDIWDQGFKVLNDIESIEAQGFEASITWNPTRTWRMRINVAQQETVRTDISPNLTRFINEDFLPFINKWGHLKMSDPASAGEDDTLSMKANEDLTEYYLFKASEGLPNPEQREWRVSLVTNYSFREGPLNGFSIGGSARWQDAMALGYGLTEREVIPGVTMLTSDINKPYMSSEEWSYDLSFGYNRKLTQKVSWDVRLNARNLQNIDSDELSVVVAQPDGSAARVRFDPPFQLVLTNTFRW